MLAINLGCLEHPHFLHPFSKSYFKVARLQLYQIYFFLPLLIYFLYHYLHTLEYSQRRIEILSKSFLLYPQYLEQWLTYSKNLLIINKWKTSVLVPRCFSVRGLPGHFVELWCNCRYNCSFIGRRSMTFRRLTDYLEQKNQNATKELI